MKLLIGALAILFSINAFCEMNWNKFEFGYVGETVVLTGNYTDEIKELLEEADEDVEPFVVTSAMASISSLKYSLMFDWLHFDLMGSFGSYTFTDADDYLDGQNTVNITQYKGGMWLTTGSKSSLYGYWNMKDEFYFDYDPVDEELKIKKENISYVEAVLEQVLFGDKEKGSEFGFRVSAEMEGNGTVIRQRSGYAFDLYVNFESSDHKFKFWVGGRGVSKKTRNADEDDPDVDTEFNFSQRDVYAGLVYGFKF